MSVGVVYKQNGVVGFTYEYTNMYRNEKSASCDWFEYATLYI